MSKTWIFKRIVDDKTPIRMLAQEDFDLHQFDSMQNEATSNKNAMPWHKQTSGLLQHDDILQGIAQVSFLQQYIQNVDEHEQLFAHDAKDLLSEQDVRIFVYVFILL